MTLKQTLQISTLLGTLCLASSAFSIQCFMTIVKDSCWINYNVTVDVIDAGNESVLLTIDIPKGTPWGRKSFDAHVKQRLMLRARFSPAIWGGEDDRQYFATRYWALPETIDTEATSAWHIGACFPQNFSSVPLPADAGSNCHCDKSQLPDVKP